MTCYYNDSEPFVCDWLENLIREGLLPAGEVDRRPIQEVSPNDVRGFTQCHFFAGIGGWAYALRLAGWGDRPVWTGSCPCQPFSAAGKGQAEDDPRHLWPYWFRLIRECRPQRVFGEQVANGIGKGWFDVVATELEAEAYTVGAVVLGAHSVGAPHIRQRLWFVADRTIARRCAQSQRSGEANGRASAEPRRLRSTRVMADSLGAGLEKHGEQPAREESATAERSSSARVVAESPCEQVGTFRLARANWDACDWLPCRDGKTRPVEPGTFPLAHGVPARVGRLRGYGNAINPYTAAAFVMAYMEVSA